MASLRRILRTIVPHKSSHEGIDPSILNECERILETFIHEGRSAENWYTVNLKELQVASEINALPPEHQVVLLQVTLERCVSEHSVLKRDFTVGTLVGGLLPQLFRRKLPFKESDLINLLKVSGSPAMPLYSFPMQSFVSQLERYFVSNEMTPRLREELEAVTHTKLFNDNTVAVRKCLERIQALLGDLERGHLEPGDPWADQALSNLAAMDAPQETAWKELLGHAASASSARPSKKWLAAAEAPLGEIEPPKFARYVSNWMADYASANNSEKYGDLAAQYSRDCVTNGDILKGLVWICATVNDDTLAQSVGELAIRCFKKVPQYGPFSVKVGNACLYTLGAMPNKTAVAQLSVVKQKVKYASANKMIDAAMVAAAKTAGVTPEELEELAVPTFGLNQDAILCERLGECEAEISIHGHEVRLSWIKQSGKRQKTVPADIKEAYADDIKRLKKTVKDLTTMLDAQKVRLERLYVPERSIPWARWQKHYLNHPLMMHLVRRLIWSFSVEDSTVNGIWWNGDIVNASGQNMEFNYKGSTVTLWHPANETAEAVQLWRHWLEEHEVCQPFKQAHREIYILTDAERQTENYSNRFAAHVLKQHQFSALCQQRGWKYALQGAFDSHNIPYRHIPELKITAEFWVDCVHGLHEVSDSGIYLHTTSDQVRFVDEAGEAIPLERVPRIVFSELMRDVDLFVGVASIGNDPTWGDQGDRHQAYWESFAFGDLSAQAETRKDVLSRLLPRLRIADQCTLGDRFLVVRGNLRTYKIHIGSGNIQMEPNHQYLCIVPGRSSQKKQMDRVFLPFEGDHVLSIIVSKALMLAEDDKIKDKTILSQIRRR